MRPGQPRPRLSETETDRDRESRFCLGLGTCLYRTRQSVLNK